MAMANRADSVTLLNSVTCPTLVVLGEEDHTTPLADAQLMAKGIPGARLTIIPAAGHLSNLEQPETFNRIVSEFLSPLAG